jgi:hypothetical protein
MRSIHIAEWILRLLTSQGRAAPMVGDLAEQAASRGVVWFWAGVLRIAASLLWRAVAENPARIIGVAFIGLAVEGAATLLIVGLSGVAVFVAARSGHPVQLTSTWGTIGIEAPCLVVTLLVGRMLARLAPGRELGACLAYMILNSILSFVMTFVAVEIQVGLTALAGPHIAFSTYIWCLLSDTAEQAPVLAGAVWGRHRRLAAR